MNLDKYGLPVQADGDPNDQLQRVGMIGVGEILTGKSIIAYRPGSALRALQSSPGVYRRWMNGKEDNVSADQLIAALAYWVVAKERMQVFRMFVAMMKRGGFAQNYKDGLDGSTKTKMPDFMLIRALPLFLRIHWCLCPLIFAFDALLVLSALSAIGPVWKDDEGFKARSLDDVDDNNTVITLSVCRAVYPSLLGIIGLRIYAKLRPVNFGNTLLKVDNRVQGALEWYHRPGSGGNPEIAELYKPIIERWFS
jgi:hypothetical protein